METGLQLLKTVGALVLVLGIFFAVIYILKRWGSVLKKPASQPMLQVLSKVSFGTRHHLMLVDVNSGQKVLVGISPQNLSLLAVGPHDPGAPKIENP